MTIKRVRRTQSQIWRRLGRMWALLGVDLAARPASIPDEVDSAMEHAAYCFNQSREA